MAAALVSIRDAVYFDLTLGGKPIGRLNMQLFTSIVPLTCANFRGLSQGAYKNCPFHRIISGFMAQGGDYADHGGNTGGKPAFGGDFFKDENFKLKHTDRGILSMANKGPNTNTSQFFITFAPTPHLDGKHVVFGKIVEGMELLDVIESVATDSSDVPVAGCEVIIANCGVVEDKEEIARLHCLESWVQEKVGDEVEEVKQLDNVASSASGGESLAEGNCDIADHFSDLNKINCNCEFRPALFYQVVAKWHVATRDLSFKVNLTTGINQARYVMKGVDLESGPKERLQSAIESQTKIVSSDKGEEDSANVTKLLKNAATWNNGAMVEYVIRTCYVTEKAALPALEEASSLGLEDIISVFLKAGVSPTNVLPSNVSKKNAFMVACENGQESCASLLLRAMKEPGQAYLKATNGLTAFDMLRNSDMNGVARRLEAQYKTQFP